MHPVSSFSIWQDCQRKSLVTKDDNIVILAQHYHKVYFDNPNTFSFSISDIYISCVKCDQDMLEDIVRSKLYFIQNLSI